MSNNTFTNHEGYQVSFCFSAGRLKSLTVIDRFGIKKTMQGVYVAETNATSQKGGYCPVSAIRLVTTTAQKALRQRNPFSFSIVENSAGNHLVFSCYGLLGAGKNKAWAFAVSSLKIVAGVAVTALTAGAAAPAGAALIGAGVSSGVYTVVTDEEDITPGAYIGHSVFGAVSGGVGTALAASAGGAQALAAQGAAKALSNVAAVGGAGAAAGKATESATTIISEVVEELGASRASYKTPSSRLQSSSATSSRVSSSTRPKESKQTQEWARDLTRQGARCSWMQRQPRDDDELVAYLRTGRLPTVAPVSPFYSRQRSSSRASLSPYFSETESQFIARLRRQDRLYPHREYVSSSAAAMRYQWPTSASRRLMFTVPDPFEEEFQASQDELPIFCSAAFAPEEQMTVHKQTSEEKKSATPLYTFPTATPPLQRHIARVEYQLTNHAAVLTEVARCLLEASETAACTFRVNQQLCTAIQGVRKLLDYHELITQPPETAWELAKTVSTEVASTVLPEKASKPFVIIESTKKLAKAVGDVKRVATIKMGRSWYGDQVAKLESMLPTSYQHRVKQKNPKSVAEIKKWLDAAEKKVKTKRKSDGVAFFLERLKADKKKPKP